MRVTASGFGIEVTTDVTESLDGLDVASWFPPGFSVVPDAGREPDFRVSGRPDDIWISGTKGVITRVPTAHDARINLLLCLAPMVDGPVVNLLHAGAVATPHGALVFAGASGSGKSRLTKVLADAGCGYLSDEIAAVAPSGEVHPWPKPISIRYDERLAPGLYQPEALGFDVVRDPVPIAAVLLLEFEPGSGLDVEELGAAEAVVRLLPHAFSARDPSLLARLRAVAERVPVLRGRRGEATNAVRDFMALAAGYALRQPQP